MTNRIIGLVAAAAFALASVATPAWTQDSKPSFPEGSTMDSIQKRGRLIVGIKYDQPGIGLMNPSTGSVEGFDVEMAKIVANALGLTSDDIEFKETVSKNRIPFVTNGLVDVVIAFFGVTDRNREAVGMAGPYIETGTQALVRIEERDKYKTVDDLKGIKACAATGSDTLRIAAQIGAEPIGFDTYNECVQQLITGGVDAMLLTGVLLAGYAEQNRGKVAITVEPFHHFPIGMALKREDAEFCHFLNQTIQAAIDDGSWQEAFDSTIGQMGADRVPPPSKVGPGC